MSLRVTITNAEPEGSTSSDILVRRRKFTSIDDGVQMETVPGLDDQVVKPAHAIEVVTSADIPVMIDEYRGQPLYLTPKEVGSGG